MLAKCQIGSAVRLYVFEMGIIPLLWVYQRKEKKKKESAMYVLRSEDNFSEKEPEKKKKKHLGRVKE